MYGGGGAMGGALARALARGGATVYLTGRTLANFEKVAQHITAAGGRADVAEVDTHDAADLRALITGTALGRLPRLAEVADTAASASSDHAGAMTGAVVNLTCGAIVD